MASFQFTPRSTHSDNLMAMLPLQISNGARSADVLGMIDSASTINVLPYSLGAALGAIWEEQQVIGNLTGALSRVTARGLVVQANSSAIAGAQDVALLFAWASTDEVPVLFGQLNFLMEFNVCFYRSQNYFEVWRS
ncbi:MAG: hypothetical protein F4X02_17975 [Chloroflexi bacterium]|nr:hypothetical protein [Chloroflexota bacterium]